MGALLESRLGTNSLNLVFQDGQLGRTAVIEGCGIQTQETIFTDDIALSYQTVLIPT